MPCSSRLSEDSGVDDRHHWEEHHRQENQRDQQHPLPGYWSCHQDLRRCPKDSQTSASPQQTDDFLDGPDVIPDTDSIADVMIEGLSADRGDSRTGSSATSGVGFRISWRRSRSFPRSTFKLASCVEVACSRAMWLSDTRPSSEMTTLRRPGANCFSNSVPQLACCCVMCCDRPRLPSYGNEHKHGSALNA